MGISVGAVFKPGDKVLRSGVYRVAHGGTHSREHDVTCIYGMTFPYCNECGASCQFTLRCAVNSTTTETPAPRHLVVRAASCETTVGFATISATNQANAGDSHLAI